jgi:hypothetical protein
VVLDGLITGPRILLTAKIIFETEEEARAQQRAVEP